jgi:hypothetical protein
MPFEARTGVVEGFLIVAAAKDFPILNTLLELTNGVLNQENMRNRRAS